MIDASSLKAAGWQRIVAELTAPAPDDRAFMERLVRVLAQVSAARQGVVFALSAGDGQSIEPKVELVWPPTSPGGSVGREGGGGGDGPGELGVEYAKECRDAARACMESGQSRVLGLDRGSDLYYEAEGGKGYVLAIPLHQHVGTRPARDNTVQLAVVGAVTLLIEPRSKDAIRSTLAMAEVLAGYLHGHAAAQRLRRLEQAGLALELGTRLIGSINTATTFKGACLQLVNDLAKQFSLDRVALGWVRSDACRVLAISDVEHFDRRTQMVQKIAAAMNECLDQEQAVLHPAPPAEGPGADVLLSQAITHAHRELAASNAKLKVASIPLRVDEDVVGVVLVESGQDGVAGSGGAPDIASVELVQAALDLVAPALKIRRSDGRNIFLRAADDACKAGAWAVGPKHTVWKLVGIVTIATLLFLSLYRTTYRPGAESTLEPRNRRIVSVPLEGVIKRIGEGVEPGRRVESGQVLVELDSTEWLLGLADAEAKVLQARTQAAAARAARQQDKVLQAEQQEQSALAEANMLRSRIERSKIAAPIAGTIIAGDLTSKVGGAVKVGDELLQIADLSDIVVTARVDERDIALVKEAFDAGRGAGQVATKGRPNQPFDFTVERIVPLASAEEGKNVFEVRGALKGSAEWLRPGMEGIAKFDTERMSLMRIGTRRIIDQARLWLWWW